MTIPKEEKDAVFVKRKMLWNSPRGRSKRIPALLEEALCLWIRCIHVPSSVFKLINQFVSLISKFIKITSNGKSKSLEPIYFTSDVFACRIYIFLIKKKLLS